MESGCVGDLSSKKKESLPLRHLEVYSVVSNQLKVKYVLNRRVRVYYTVSSFFSCTNLSLDKIHMEGILKVPHSINEEDITSDSQTKIILKCKKVYGTCSWYGFNTKRTT